MKENALKQFSRPVCLMNWVAKKIIKAVKSLTTFDLNKLDIYKSASQCTMPVIVIGSIDDEIIPYQHIVEVYTAIKSKKEFLEVTESHNTMRDDEIIRIIIEFLAS